MQDLQKLSGPAALLNVYARDAVGTRVGLQIFTVHFTDLDDHVGHLLGIQELSREECNVPVEVRPNLRYPDIPVRRRSHAQPNESVTGSSSDGSSNASASFLPLVHPEANFDEVVIWFDPATMVVLQTTPAFTTIGGPSSEGTDLRDWLVDPVPFANKVQTYCNMLMNQGEDEGSDIPTITIVGLKLQPPIAVRAHILYMVDVCVTEEENSQMNDRDFTMRATITNITQRRCSRKKRSHRQQSGRSARDARSDSESHVRHEPEIYNQQEACKSVMAL